jgi:hypothetical protein
MNIKMNTHIPLAQTPTSHQLKSFGFNASYPQQKVQTNINGFATLKQHHSAFERESISKSYSCNNHNLRSQSKDSLHYSRANRAHTGINMSKHEILPSYTNSKPLSL